MNPSRSIMAALTVVWSLVAGTGALPPKAADAVADLGSSTPLPKLLREIVQDVKSARDDQLRDVWLLIAIAKAQAKVGDRDAARATLEYAVQVAEAQSPRPAVDGLVAIAYAHWDSGDRKAIPKVLRQAHQAADTMPDTSRGKEGLLVEIGTAEAWTGDSAAARETARTLRLIVEVGLDENARSFGLAEVAELQSKSGDYEAALRTAETGGNDAWKAVYWGRIAEVASSANHYYLQPPRELTQAQRAERLEVVHRILQVYRDPSFQVAIALGDLGATDEALQTARRIAKAQAPGLPDARTAMPWVLTRVAAAQAKFGHPDAAKTTFQEALGLIRGDPEMGDRLEQVASGQAQSGDVQGALKTVDLIPPARRGRILLAIAAIQARHGDQTGATKTLRLALEDAKLCLAQPPTGKPGTLGANPDFWRSNAMTTIATAQARLGDFASALVTAKGVLPTRRGQALSEVAEAQARAGKVDDAMAWVKRLSQPRERALALQGLAEGIASARATDGKGR